MPSLPSPARFRGRVLDISGTVTTGGTAQMISKQNANRDYLFVQNHHATADLWLNFAIAAVPSQPSIRIPAGADLSFETSFLPTDGIWVFSSVTGHPFTAKEG